MNRFFTPPLLSFFSLFIFSGCLISETAEYKLLLNEDEKSGSFIIVRGNMQSDASSMDQQEKDFTELMGNWKSDEYLLQQMNKNVYVKERTLALDHGKLVWKETLIFSDVTKLFPDLKATDTVRIPFKESDGNVISTNGSIRKDRGTTIVLWPPHTRRFVVKTRTREFTPSSDFAKRFAAYRKKKG